MKTLDRYFTDWEEHYFGYGYGTGEPHTFQALRNFFFCVPKDHSYDYRNLELCCTPQVAWLLINTLARADVIMYGTSPRYAWLTENGKALAEYIVPRTVEQLIEATDHDENYVACFPDYCNCVGQHHAGCCLLNPFWRERD